MGLLQGPRLMAWTTKSPIQGNHWVPLGCRALLMALLSKNSEIFTTADWPKTSSIEIAYQLTLTLVLTWQFD